MRKIKIDTTAVKKRKNRPLYTISDIDKINADVIKDYLYEHSTILYYLVKNDMFLIYPTLYEIIHDFEIGAIYNNSLVYAVYMDMHEEFIMELKR